ncbi:hypothetical protein DFH11DRAFT_1586904 [Phellopilus nigrolimitatus]|nr:hypothetical protein DFH11DRAFT_1586904 [Phellopilus nigrolimitatus]
MSTDPLTTLIFRDQVVKYMTVASATFHIYDCMITFSEEVELIWRAKWGFGKVLFFLTRYLAYVDPEIMIAFLFHPNLTAEVCGTLVTATQYLVIVGNIVAGTIMSMRVYALWSNSRRILYVLIALNLYLIIPSIVIFHMRRPDGYFYASPIPTLLPCAAAYRTSRVDQTFIVYLIFASFDFGTFSIVVLTMWKGIRQWSQNIRDSKIMVIFYRDGMVYFLILAAFSVMNSIIFLARIDPADYYELLATLQRVLHSVLTARMLLNLRRVAAGGGDAQQGVYEMVTSLHFTSATHSKAKPTWTDVSMLTDTSTFNVRESTIISNEETVRV